MHLPEIPSVDLNTPVVEIYMMACRDCPAHGPWISMVDRENIGHLWDINHEATMQHHRYYRWALTRQTARVV